MTDRTAPPGYQHAQIGRATLVARTNLLPALHDILQQATLHEFAASRPDRRELVGRGMAYAVLLPGTRVRAVVRHNRHGGFFAAVTRDLFLAPTRAPLELAISAQLTAAGVPTPELLGYAIYPAGGILARADVLTREVTPSQDLGAALAPSEAEHARQIALDATAVLVAALSRVGARHHDLNVKNVLLTENRGVTVALVLDVDRITFGHSPHDALAANLDRLERSARKRGAPMSDEALIQLRLAAAAHL